MSREITHLGTDLAVSFASHNGAFNSKAVLMGQITGLNERIGVEVGMNGLHLSMHFLFMINLV